MTKEQAYEWAARIEAEAKRKDLNLVKLNLAQLTRALLPLQEGHVRPMLQVLESGYLGMFRQSGLERMIDYARNPYPIFADPHDTEPLVFAAALGELYRCSEIWSHEQGGFMPLYEPFRRPAR